MENALIVVAKEPVPGRTKTRLCPPFTSESAAQFYHCLLLDTLALMARLDVVDHTLAYTPDSARAYFERLVPNGFRLVPQRGNDLGERLANALAHHFDQGYQRAVIMNSDGPTLPQAYLEEAFSALDAADVTLGLSHDGGYYLIGMKRLHSNLFRGIDWSTDQVVAQTLASCRRLGLTVHQLPAWYDVDVEADLERLTGDLARDPASAPRTWAFLQSWGGGAQPPDQELAIPPVAEPPAAAPPHSCYP
jgi:rSAM/selenodomain-associated transferase 1